MKALLERAIETIARARAPKEPPAPAGPELDGAAALERPACSLCGNTRSKKVVEAVDTWIQDRERRFRVVRCEICAHRYTTPRFKRSSKHLAFEGDYPFYARARQARAGESVGDRAAARAPFDGRADRLREVMAQPGRVLDVGCGDGFFLDAMRSRGWQVRGVDVEEVVAWHAREQLGIDATVADLEDDELPGGPFDAVTLWGVLQLVYEPQAALERIRDRLTAGGVIAIGVSNINSSGARLFGPKWRGLGLPRHLSHFTPETLTRLLEWSGFEVVKTHFETPRWIIAHSADDAMARPLAKLTKAALLPTMGLAGVTRYGDTMEIYAKIKER